MCLIIVRFQTDATTPLMVAANRDEKLDRPAVSATVLHDSAPRIVGGRDLLAGGTWLAVNEHGVVAGLTNRPSATGRDPSKRSRGELPLALASHTNAKSAVEDFVARFRPSDFNLAWLLVGDPGALYYLALGDDGTMGAETLGPGTHVLGNGPLHEPSAKTDLIRERLAGAERNRSEAPPQWLGPVLADHTIPPHIVSEPPSEHAPELYAACVHTEGYGTRSAVVVSVPPAGHPNVWVADDPPCRAPFRNVDHLWSRTT